MGLVSLMEGISCENWFHQTENFLGRSQMEVQLRHAWLMQNELDSMLVFGEYFIEPY